MKKILKKLLVVMGVCILALILIQSAIAISHWMFPAPYLIPVFTGEYSWSACGGSWVDHYTYEYQVSQPIEEVKIYYEDQIKRMCRDKYPNRIFKKCQTEENCLVSTCELYNASAYGYSIGREFIVVLKSLPSGGTEIYHSTHIWKGSIDRNYGCGE